MKVDAERGRVGGAGAGAGTGMHQGYVCREYVRWHGYVQALPAGSDFAKAQEEVAALWGGGGQGKGQKTRKKGTTAK